MPPAVRRHAGSGRYSWTGKRSGVRCRKSLGRQSAWRFSVGVGAGQWSCFPSVVRCMVTPPSSHRPLEGPRQVRAAVARRPGVPSVPCPADCSAVRHRRIPTCGPG
ncbi:hypothetical protein ACFFX0_12595 [Citricoccus parietis]|uniref:Uncharacterized protein n=1 Tax=Citricoccus parietis TaxID=592307 RepID=A0ABV5FZ87_9MICC